MNRDMILEREVKDNIIVNIKDVNKKDSYISKFIKQKFIKFNRRHLYAFILSFALLIIISLSFLITFNVFIKDENNKAYAAIPDVAGQPLPNADPTVLYSWDSATGTFTITGHGALPSDGSFSVFDKCLWNCNNGNCDMGSKNTYPSYAFEIKHLVFQGDDNADGSRLVFPPNMIAYIDGFNGSLRNLTDVTINNCDFSNVNNINWLCIYCTSLQRFETNNCLPTQTLDVDSSYKIFSNNYELLYLDLSWINFGSNSSSALGECFSYEIILPNSVGANNIDLCSLDNYLAYDSNGALIDNNIYSNLIAKNQNGKDEYKLVSALYIDGDKVYNKDDAIEIWNLYEDNVYYFLFDDGTLVFDHPTGSGELENYNCSFVGKDDTYYYFNYYNLDSSSKQFYFINKLNNDINHVYKIKISDLNDSINQVKTSIDYNYTFIYNDIYLTFTPWSKYQVDHESEGFKIDKIILGNTSILFDTYSLVFSNLPYLKYVEFGQPDDNNCCTNNSDSKNIGMFFNSGSKTQDGLTIKFADNSINFAGSSDFNNIFNGTKNVTLDFSAVPKNFYALSPKTKIGNKIIYIDNYSIGIDPYDTKIIYTPKNENSDYTNDSDYNGYIKSKYLYGYYNIMKGYKKGSNPDGSEDTFVNYYSYMPTQSIGVDYLKPLKHDEAIIALAYLYDDLAAISNPNALTTYDYNYLNKSILNILANYYTIDNGVKKPIYLDSSVKLLCELQDELVSDENYLYTHDCILDDKFAINMALDIMQERLKASKGTRFNDGLSDETYEYTLGLIKDYIINAYKLIDSLEIEKQTSGSEFYLNDTYNIELKDINVTNDFYDISNIQYTLENTTKVDVLSLLDGSERLDEIDDMYNIIDNAYLYSPLENDEDYYFIKYNLNNNNISDFSNGIKINFNLCGLVSDNPFSEDVQIEIKKTKKETSPYLDDAYISLAKLYPEGTIFYKLDSSDLTNMKVGDTITKNITIKAFKDNTNYRINNTILFDFNVSSFYDAGYDVTFKFAKEANILNRTYSKQKTDNALFDMTYYNTLSDQNIMDCIIDNLDDEDMIPDMKIIDQDDEKYLLMKIDYMDDDYIQTPICLDFMTDCELDIPIYILGPRTALFNQEDIMKMMMGDESLLDDKLSVLTDFDEDKEKDKLEAITDFDALDLDYVKNNFVKTYLKTAKSNFGEPNLMFNSNSFKGMFLMEKLSNILSGPPQPGDPLYDLCLEAEALTQPATYYTYLAIPLNTQCTGYTTPTDGKYTFTLNKPGTYTLKPEIKNLLSDNYIDNSLKSLQKVIKVKDEENPNPNPTPDPDPAPDPKPDDKPSITTTTITIGGIVTEPNSGYIRGYGDRTIKPNDGITRAEFIKIMAETAPNFSTNDQTNLSALDGYDDVNENSWYAPYIGYLLKCKVLTGYDDKSIKPNDKITRAEVCSIISNMYDPKASGDNVDNGLSNSNSFNRELDNMWFKECVTKLVNAGIINGYEDGTFKPNNKITRAETVALVNRTLGIKNAISDYQKQYVINNYNDLKESDWFFSDIARAIFNK